MFAAQTATPNDGSTVIVNAPSTSRTNRAMITVAARPACAARRGRAIPLPDLPAAPGRIPPAIAALLQHVAVVRDRQALSRALLHHQHRNAQRVDRLDLGEHVVLHLRREPCRRLVEDQDVRIGHQRAADRQHLPLAARQRRCALMQHVPQQRQRGEHRFQLLRQPMLDRQRADLEVFEHASFPGTRSPVAAPCSRRAP